MNLKECWTSTLSVCSRNLIFLGEDAIDQGGPRREFFELLAEEVFNPSKAFTLASDGGSLDIPCIEYLSMEVDYKFYGSILGLAVFHETIVEAQLAKYIWKYLLGQQPVLEDLLELDPQMHKILVELL
jgi:ubiquitin-protein ligase E3 A